MQHHKYSLREIESLMPWERDIYVNLLTAYIKEENEKRQREAQK
jgi:phage terminase large subunit-like protein